METIGGRDSSAKVEVVITEPRQDENRTSGQLVVTVANPERSSTLTEWLLPILTDGGQQGNQQSQAKPRIQKVLMILRDIEKNKECYEPMVVSIGPYYHGKPKFEPLEKLKTKMAQKLFGGRDIKEFHKFDEIARNARECYAEDSEVKKFEEEEFRRMMFLDGCFVLHFIRFLVNGYPEDAKIKAHLIPIAIRDMFLLENQLPLQLLRKLHSLLVPGDTGEQLVGKFIHIYIFNSDYNFSPLQDYNEAPHLLHLLRTKLIGTAPPQNQGTIPEGYDYYSFRTVSELKEAGIKCKSSDSRGLKNVTFVPRVIYGDLLLPEIAIDDGFKTKYLNLVAYEACPDFHNDYSVTSYISFMDSLIDSADDVKELRSKGILHNSLGSDKHVADLFNELAINLVPNFGDLNNVKNLVEKYYRKKYWKWMAKLLHTHFSSPWTIIGFCAAVLLLLLTLAQTIFTVFNL